MVKHRLQTQLTNTFYTKCKDSWWCPSSTWRCHIVCLISFKVGGSTLKKTKTAHNWVSCKIITQNLKGILSSLKSRSQLVWMTEKGRPLTITKESVNLTNFNFASYFWKEQVVHVPWKLINLIKTLVIDIAIKFRVLNTVATTKPGTHLTNILVLSTDQVGCDYWQNSWN